MSRFKVGKTVYMDRGDKMRTLVVAKVHDNPMVPVYQYSFEAPNDGFACGEQSLRDTADGKDLKMSDCFKENYTKEAATRVNTIASALRQVVSEESSGLFYRDEVPKLSIFDDFRVDFKPDLKLVKWLVNYANGRIIIHVGSGQGHLVNMLKWQGGGRAMGIEPNFNKQEWIKWRMHRDGADIDVNEILEGDVQKYASLIKASNDKAILLITRPKVKDFVEETVEIMPSGMELIYVTTDKIRSVKTDYCFYETTSIEQLRNEGCSEDDELIYSMIK